MFCYCYYVHYAMITTKNKLIFIPTLLSLHNCHENKTTTQLSWEKNSSIFSIRKFSVSKRFIHDTVVSPSGTSVESYMLYYPCFLSPEVKRCAIITYNHGIYKLPHELPNFLRWLAWLIWNWFLLTNFSVTW